MSRFAFIRPADHGLVIESALNNRQFPLRSASVIRIIAALARPTQLESLLSSVRAEEREILCSFLNGCNQAQLLTRVGEDGVTEEDAGPLGYWEFHDLVFHTASRLGRNRRPIGGTYRLKDRLAQESPLGCDEVDDQIALPKPGVDVLNIALRDALAHRRSQYGEKPLTIEALGAFTYWTCRVTHVRNTENDVHLHKLYPSGGSLHPLRVYIAIDSCAGCPTGLYRYLDREHSLGRLPAPEAAVRKFLSDAASSTGGLAQKPTMLFIISARFHRTAWKYESIAYRLILLETGTLLQTMYLAATALGLKGCALGCGDSDHFAQTAQTNYYTETSVGEFLLGA
ncbi:MAG TPA: SagB family peptide dehydrogenase [Candidatus Angelobacter sp.]|nr:SagB family peptide dehydrogenase [Candidatus Angelobacter sp.]